nr:MAG TPA: hypothetical protein [Bacteriophage sp.]
MLCQLAITYHIFSIKKSKLTKFILIKILFLCILYQISLTHRSAAVMN